MKIALVCDWYRPRLGGIESHLEQLATHLAAAGHDITVVTPTRGSTQSAPGVNVVRMPATLLPKIGLIFTPAAFRQLGATLRNGSFDVVHVHNSLISPAAYGAAYLAQKAGLPTVITMHSISSVVFCQVLDALDRFAHWTRWPIVFSAVSDRVIRDLLPIMGDTPVHVLPNAVDPAEWQFPLRPPSNLVNLACVMRLASRKRGAALLRALAVARRRLPGNVRVCLQLAGDGPERRRLEQLARRLDLTDSVRFHGAITTAQVKALLAESHFFVLPSMLESFGLAALEARAAGLPVLAMRDSGVSHFIAHEIEGLLAANDDDLAEQLRRLCTDAALRKAITQHNQNTAIAFTWDRTLAEHLALYAEARQLRGLPRSD